MALHGLAAPARQELMTLFPDLWRGAVSEVYGTPSRRYSARRMLPPHLRALRQAGLAAPRDSGTSGLRHA
jgi:hypothetical protein